MEAGASSSSGGDSDGAVLLAGKDDHYGGFIIDPLGLPPDPSIFLCRLRHSLSQWKSEEGFRYHHAEEDYVMLTKWIPETPSTLPANASHQVGIGAMVINDQNEVLVVQEKTGPTQGSGVWKIPTGVVIQGENIKDAAVREVAEETGVKVEFVEVLGIRQAHDVAFGKSDLFFLCLLQPLSSEITTQDTEITAAQWMHLGEFRSQPFNSESGLLTRIADIATASVEKEYTGFAPELLTFGFRKKGSYFYHNTKDIYKYLEQKNSKI